MLVDVSSLEENEFKKNLGNAKEELCIQWIIFGIVNTIISSR